MSAFTLRSALLMGVPLSTEILGMFCSVSHSLSTYRADPTITTCFSSEYLRGIRKSAKIIQDAKMRQSVFRRLFDFDPFKCQHVDKFSLYELAYHSPQYSSMNVRVCAHNVTRSFKCFLFVLKRKKFLWCFKSFFAIVKAVCSVMAATWFASQLFLLDLKRRQVLKSWNELTVLSFFNRWITVLPFFSLSLIVTK